MVTGCYRRHFLCSSNVSLKFVVYHNSLCKPWSFFNFQWQFSNFCFFCTSSSSDTYCVVCVRCFLIHFLLLSLLNVVFCQILVSVHMLSNFLQRLMHYQSLHLPAFPFTSDPHFGWSDCFSKQYNHFNLWITWHGWSTLQHKLLINKLHHSLIMLQWEVLVLHKALCSHCFK